STSSARSSTSANRSGARPPAPLWFSSNRPMTELRGSDVAAMREQLGRDPTTQFSVVARCPGGHPLVIRNHPLDAEGKPFPTLYWLTCPEAVKRVASLESEGWIDRLEEE